MSKFLCIKRARTETISDEGLRSRISEITARCFANNSKGTNKRYRRIRALRDLMAILRNSERRQLHLLDPREMITCTIKILAEFEEASHRSDDTCEWKRRRDCKIARVCYHDLLRSFIPEKSRDIVNSLLGIIHRERLWHLEDLCREVTRDLLKHGIAGAAVIHGLLDRVEIMSTGIHDARELVRILYEIMDDYSWPKSDETVMTIERLLKLYYGSLSVSQDNVVPPYGPLRKGLEVSLRHMIKNLKNEHLLVVVYHMCAWTIVDKACDSTILDFGNTLEYAAHMHETRLYEDTLTERIFPIIMRMISSSSRLVSLLGNRVIHHLLDRRDNRGQFDTPRIFFESTNYEIRRVENCDKRDKYFLRANREILHDSLVKGAMRHSSTLLNLESVYCTVCLLAVEVPCGFTAAAIVCLVMNLQDITLENTDILREVACHVHATVMAIMSLLCWLHEARIFYTYVNKIMITRAELSPHLNPPLKARYSYAVHHVTWDKPELFFVDWEARYGLWKCFRLRENQRRSTDASNSANSSKKERIKSIL